LQQRRNIQAAAPPRIRVFQLQVGAPKQRKNGSRGGGLAAAATHARSSSGMGYDSSSLVLEFGEVNGIPGMAAAQSRPIANTFAVERVSDEEVLMVERILSTRRLMAEYGARLRYAVEKCHQYVEEERRINFFRWRATTNKMASAGAAVSAFSSNSGSNAKAKHKEMLLRAVASKDEKTGRRDPLGSKESTSSANARGTMQSVRVGAGRSCEVPEYVLVAASTAEQVSCLKGLLRHLIYASTNAAHGSSGAGSAGVRREEDEDIAAQKVRCAPIAAMQVAMRELKIIDAVFLISRPLQVYAFESEKHYYKLELTGGDQQSYRALCKLGYKLLEHIFWHNGRNHRYIGSRSYTRFNPLLVDEHVSRGRPAWVSLGMLRLRDEQEMEKMKYIDEIVKHVGKRINATMILETYLTDSTHVHEAVRNQILEKYLKRIMELGPQATNLMLVSKMCVEISADGTHDFRADTQERLLEKLGIRIRQQQPAGAGGGFGAGGGLGTLGFGGMARGGFLRKQYALNRLHMLMETVLKREDEDEDDRARIMSDFKGDGDVDLARADPRAVEKMLLGAGGGAGLGSVYVSWQGCEGWQPHCKELYYSAKELGFVGPGFQPRDNVRFYKGSSLGDDEREIGVHRGMLEREHGVSNPGAYLVQYTIPGTSSRRPARDVSHSRIRRVANGVAKGTSSSSSSSSSSSEAYRDVGAPVWMKGSADPGLSEPRGSFSIYLMQDLLPHFDVGDGHGVEDGDGGSGIDGGAVELEQLQKKELDERQWVRVEDLCWPLDPVGFYPLLFGRPAPAYTLRKKWSPDDLKHGAAGGEKTGRQQRHGRWSGVGHRGSTVLENERAESPAPGMPGMLARAGMIGGAGGEMDSDGDVAGDEERRIAQSKKEFNRKRKLFEKQLTLARYYVEVIRLFSRCCAGRSYNAIDELEKQFTPSLIMAVLMNESVPCVVRSCFSEMMCSLFVNRYPNEVQPVPCLVHEIQTTSLRMLKASHFSAKQNRRAGSRRRDSIGALRQGRHDGDDGMIGDSTLEKTKGAFSIKSLLSSMGVLGKGDKSGGGIMMTQLRNGGGTRDRKASFGGGAASSWMGRSIDDGEGGDAEGDEGATADMDRNDSLVANLFRSEMDDPSEYWGRLVRFSSLFVRQQCRLHGDYGMDTITSKPLKYFLLHLVNNLAYLSKYAEIQQGEMKEVVPALLMLLDSRPPEARRYGRSYHWRTLRGSLSGVDALGQPSSDMGSIKSVRNPLAGGGEWSNVVSGATAMADGPAPPVMHPMEAHAMEMEEMASHWLDRHRDTEATAPTTVTKAVICEMMERSLLLQIEGYMVRFLKAFQKALRPFRSDRHATGWKEHAIKQPSLALRKCVKHVKDTVRRIENEMTTGKVFDLVDREEFCELCFDLMMYEDKRLFDAALRLLINAFTMREIFWQKLVRVQLITHRKAKAGASPSDGVGSPLPYVMASVISGATGATESMSLSARYLRVSGQMVLARQCMQAYEKWGTGRGGSGGGGAGGRGGGGGGGGGGSEDREHEKIYEYVESVLLEMSAMCLRTDVLLGSPEEGIGVPTAADEDEEMERGGSGPERYMGFGKEKIAKNKKKEAQTNYRVSVRVSHDESDANNECQNLLNKMGIEDFITECLGVPLPKANDPHADLRRFSRRLRELLIKFNAFLAHFVLGNRANQALVFRHWRAVLALMPFDVGVPSVLVNLFQNNQRLCERVPEEICVAMAKLMERDLTPDHRGGWKRSYMAFFRNLIMPAGVSIRANQQLVLSLLTGDLGVRGDVQGAGRQKRGLMGAARGRDGRAAGGGECDGDCDGDIGGAKKSSILLLLTEREEWNPIDEFTARIMEGIEPVRPTRAPVEKGKPLGSGARATRSRKARRYSLPGTSSGAPATTSTPASNAGAKRTRSSGRNSKRFVYSSHAYELMSTAGDALPLLLSGESYSLQQQWNDKYDELLAWYEDGRSRSASNSASPGSGGGSIAAAAAAAAKKAVGAEVRAVPWIDGYEKKNHKLYEQVQELAYHIETIRVLAFVCKGKSATFEYKCQQLMPFDIAVSVITDPRTVWAVRGAFVSFVEETYLDSVVSKYSDESSVLANSADMANVVLHFAEAIIDYDEQSQVVVALSSPYTDRHLHGGGSVSLDNNELHNQLYGSSNSGASNGKRQRASMHGSNGGDPSINPNDPRTGVTRLIQLQSSQRKRRRRRDARSRRAQAQAQNGAGAGGVSSSESVPATPPIFRHEDTRVGGSPMGDDMVPTSEKARLAVAALSDRRALEDYVFGEVLSALSSFLQRVYVADDALPAVRAAVEAAERAVVQLAGTFSNRLRAKDQLTGERVHRPIYMLDPEADPSERRLLWQVQALQQVLTQAADACVGTNDNDDRDASANASSGSGNSSILGAMGASFKGRGSVGFLDNNGRAASMRGMLQQQQQRRLLGGGLGGHSAGYGHRKRSRVEVQQLELQSLCDEASTKHGWLEKQPSSGGEWKRKEVSLTSSYLVYLGKPRHGSLDMYAEGDGREIDMEDGGSDSATSDGADSSSSSASEAAKVASASDSESGKEEEDDGRASLIDDSVNESGSKSLPKKRSAARIQVKTNQKGAASFNSSVRSSRQRHRERQRAREKQRREKRQRKVVYFSDMIAVGAMPEVGPSAFFIKTRKRTLVFRVEQLSGYGADVRFQGQEQDQRSEWVRAIASVGKVAVDLSESSELLEANTLLHQVIDEFTTKAESRAAAEGMEDETDTLCRKLQRHDRFAVAEGGSGGAGGGASAGGASVVEQPRQDSIICNMVDRMYSLTPGAGGSAGASNAGNDGLDLAPGSGSGASAGGGRNVELEQTCLKILIKTLDVVQQQKQQEEQSKQTALVTGGKSGSTRAQRRAMARQRRKQMNQEIGKVEHIKQSYHDVQGNAVHSRLEALPSFNEELASSTSGAQVHAGDDGGSSGANPAISSADGVTSGGSSAAGGGGGHQVHASAQSHDVIRPELARLFVHLVGGGEDELVVGAMALGISLLGEDGDPFVQQCIYDTLTAHSSANGGGLDADGLSVTTAVAGVEGTTGTAPQASGGVIVGGAGGSSGAGGGRAMASSTGGQGDGEAFFLQMKDRMVRGLDLVKQKKRFRKQASAQRHGAALMFGAAGSAAGAGAADGSAAASPSSSKKKKGGDAGNADGGLVGGLGGDGGDGNGHYDGGYGDDSGGDTLGLVRMFRLLKLLCEGHNSHLQLLLRDDTQHTLGFRSTHNVLGHAKDLLVTLAKSEAQLLSLDHADASTLLHLLRFFVEAVQGPCKPNQEYVASSEIVDKCSIIISANTGVASSAGGMGSGLGGLNGVAVKDAGGGSAAGGGYCAWFRKCGRGNHRRSAAVAAAGGDPDSKDGGGDKTASAAGTGLSGRIMYEIEAAAVNLLQSIMEGRTDDTIHVKVSQKMEMKLLRRRLLRFWSDRNAALNEGDAAEATRHMQGGLGLLVLIKMLCERAGQRWSEARMKQVLAEEDRKSRAEYARAASGARSGTSMIMSEHFQHEMAEMRTSMCMYSTRIYRELEKRIISVEIVWHSQLHTVYFPKNRQCDLINPRRKEAIMGESMRSGDINANAGGQSAVGGDSLHTGVAKLQKFVALCRVEKDEINRWNQLRLPVHDLHSWIPFVGLCDDLCYKCRRSWRFCFGRGDDRTNSTGVVRGLFSSGGLGVTAQGGGGGGRKRGRVRGASRSAGRKMSRKSACGKICSCCCGSVSSMVSAFGNWVVNVFLSSLLLGTLFVCVLARLLYFFRSFMFFVVSLRSKIFSYGGAFGLR
jgi:hypothetical protein